MCSVVSQFHHLENLFWHETVNKQIDAIHGISIMTWVHGLTYFYNWSLDLKQDLWYKMSIFTFLHFCNYPQLVQNKHFAVLK